MNENEIVVERDVGDHSISKVEIRGNGEQPLGISLFNIAQLFKIFNLGVSTRQV